MAKTKQSHLICLDDHRIFSEEIRKRFSDASKYRISIVPSHKDILILFEDEKDLSLCRVAIIIISDQKEQYEAAEHLALAIKKTDPRAGIILIYPGDKTEEIVKRVRFNIDAYIPKNDNAVLRLHNAVKKHISRRNLETIRKRRNLSLFILLAFLLLTALAVLVARIKFPDYF